LAPEQRRRFLLHLQTAAFFVTPEQSVDICRNPADNMVLAAAMASGDDVIIVSDDHDLPVLDPWRGIRIVKPETALALRERPEPQSRNRGDRP
jgi:uncharacterized protein